MHKLYSNINQTIIENAKYFSSILILLVILFSCGKDKTSNNTSSYNNNNTSKTNYTYGLEELQRGNYDQAKNYFQKVPKKDKKFNDAQSKLNYIRGREEFNKKDYANSLYYFSKVPSSDEYYAYTINFIDKINYQLNKMDYAFDLYAKGNSDSSLKIIRNISSDDIDYQKATELRFLIQADNLRKANKYDSALFLTEKISSESIYSNVVESFTDEIKYLIDSSYFEKGLQFYSKFEFDSSFSYFKKVEYSENLIDLATVYQDSIQAFKDTLLYSRAAYYLRNDNVDSFKIYYSKITETSPYYFELKDRFKNISEEKEKITINQILLISIPFAILCLIVLIYFAYGAYSSKIKMGLRMLFNEFENESDENLALLTNNYITKNKIPNKMLGLVLKDIIIEDKKHQRDNNKILYIFKLDKFKDIYKYLRKPNDINN